MLSEARRCVEMPQTWRGSGGRGRGGFSVGGSIVDRQSVHLLCVFTLPGVSTFRPLLFGGGGGGGGGGAG
jgi:hypothetical protein